MPRSSTWRRRRSSATCRACRSTRDPTTIPTTSRSPRGATRSTRASTRSSRFGDGCGTCRSTSTIPSGSTTPTSISTSTCGTPRSRRRAATPSSPTSWPASWDGRSIAPAALGDLRHRGAARRTLRDPHEGPPRDDRRRLRCRAAHDDARRRPRRRRGAAHGGGVASRDHAHRRARCSRAPVRGCCASPDVPSCSPRGPPASFGKATRNPLVVSAADQVRSGLRGPLGAVLNVGRARAPTRAKRSGRCRRCHLRGSRSTRRSPRTVASRSGRRRSTR